MGSIYLLQEVRVGGPTHLGWSTSRSDVRKAMHERASVITRELEMEGGRVFTSNPSPDCTSVHKLSLGFFQSGSMISKSRLSVVEVPHVSKLSTEPMGEAEMVAPLVLDSAILD